MLFLCLSVDVIEMCAECRLTKYDVRNELLQRCWSDLTSCVNWFKYNSSFWNTLEYDNECRKIVV